MEENWVHFKTAYYPDHFNVTITSGLVTISTIPRPHVHFTAMTTSAIAYHWYNSSVLKNLKAAKPPMTKSSTNHSHHSISHRVVFVT